MYSEKSLNDGHETWGTPAVMTWSGEWASLIWIWNLLLYRKVLMVLISCVEIFMLIILKGLSATLYGRPF